MYLLYSVLSPSCSGDRIRASVRVMSVRCEASVSDNLSLDSLLTCDFPVPSFLFLPPRPFVSLLGALRSAKVLKVLLWNTLFLPPSIFDVNFSGSFLKLLVYFFITRTHLFVSPFFPPFLLPVLKFSQIGFLCFCLLGSSHFGVVSWGTTLSVHCLFCYNAFLTLFFCLLFIA